MGVALDKDPGDPPFFGLDHRVCEQRLTDACANPFGSNEKGIQFYFRKTRRTQGMEPCQHAVTLGASETPVR